MGMWLEGDGDRPGLYLGIPGSDKGPGVLMLHAWWGLNADIVLACDRLAEAGFVVLAPSLYLDGDLATTIPAAETLAARHDESGDKVAALIDRTLEMLVARPDVQGERIGVVGFSLGAWWALQVAAQHPETVAATVVFYGTNDVDQANASSAFLGHFAERDDFEPLDGVRQVELAIRAAGRDVEFAIYPDTGHWFAEPGRPDAHDADAAELAWDRTIDFLRQQLGDQNG